MLLEKCSKRGDLTTSQNSENGVPVRAGVQVRVSEAGHFWSSNLIGFGLLLAVLSPGVATGAKRAFRQSPQKEPCK